MAMVAELMAAAATSWWHVTSGLVKARPIVPLTVVLNSVPTMQSSDLSDGCIDNLHGQSQKNNIFEY